MPALGIGQGTRDGAAETCPEATERAPEPRFPPCSLVCSTHAPPGLSASRSRCGWDKASLRGLPPAPELGERPHRLGGLGRLGRARIPYARLDLRDFARRWPGSLPFFPPTPNHPSKHQHGLGPEGVGGALWTVNYSHG